MHSYISVYSFSFLLSKASVDESSSSASTEVPAPPSQPQTRLSRSAGQQGRTEAQQTQHAQHAQTRLSRSRQVRTLQEAKFLLNTNTGTTVEDFFSLRTLFLVISCTASSKEAAAYRCSYLDLLVFSSVYSQGDRGRKPL